MVSSHGVRSAEHGQRLLEAFAQAGGRTRMGPLELGGEREQLRLGVGGRVGAVGKPAYEGA